MFWLRRRASEGSEQVGETDARGRGVVLWGCSVGMAGGSGWTSQGPLWVAPWGLETEDRVLIFKGGIKYTAFDPEC